MGLAFRHAQLLDEQPFGPVDGADIRHLLLQGPVPAVHLQKLSPQGRNHVQAHFQRLPGQGLGQGHNALILHLVPHPVEALPGHQQQHAHVVPGQIQSQLGAEFIPHRGIENGNVHCIVQCHALGLSGRPGPQRRVIAAAGKQCLQERKGLVIGARNQDLIDILSRCHSFPLLSLAITSRIPPAGRCG